MKTIQIRGQGKNTVAKIIGAKINKETLVLASNYFSPILLTRRDQRQIFVLNIAIFHAESESTKIFRKISHALISLYKFNLERARTV